jgi:histidinol phosphatase-like PHP family hydrolase
VDTNAVVAGWLRDLAAAQTDDQKKWGYRRAAATIQSLEAPLDTLVRPDGSLPKIANIGPASARVIREVLETGRSAIVEEAVDASGRRRDVDRSRALRGEFLSRAEALRVLADQSRGSPPRDRYRGDLQMHSVWSDGRESIAVLAEACLARGYGYCAITDHSYGLPIAGGMSPEAMRAQHAEIEALNDRFAGRFRILKGIEANIGADGSLDLSAEERQTMDIVLAAPHSQLRSAADQTPRMLAAVTTPGVHVLAHPRGRMYGSRAGVIADWDRVFAAAAREDVAIEIDGDPSRQDLDFTLARRALAAGCLLAADSDAHSAHELIYAETALAHAWKAGVPPDRLVNTWPEDQLRSWLEARTVSRPPTARGKTVRNRGRGRRPTRDGQNQK